MWKWMTGGWGKEGAHSRKRKAYVKALGHDGA